MEKDFQIPHSTIQEILQWMQYNVSYYGKSYLMQCQSFWKKYLVAFDYDTRYLFTQKMIEQGEMNKKYHRVK